MTEKEKKFLANWFYRLYRSKLITKKISQTDKSDIAREQRIRAEAKAAEAEYVFKSLCPDDTYTMGYLMRKAVAEIGIY